MTKFLAVLIVSAVLCIGRIECGGGSLPEPDPAVVENVSNVEAALIDADDPALIAATAANASAAQAACDDITSMAASNDSLRPLADVAVKVQDMLRQLPGFESSSSSLNISIHKIQSNRSIGM